MKIWPIAVIGLTCLIFSGCRTDPRITLVERDNRRLEDEIYRLRACLADYESGMVSTGTEVATTRSPRRGDRDGDKDSSAAASRDRDLPPGAQTTPPSVELHDTPENEVPEILKRSNGPANRAPNPNRTPGAFNPPRNPRAMPGIAPAGPALGGASAEEATPPAVPAENTSYSPPPKGDSFNAVQIVLHDRLCTAGETGGLRVVFEARDRHDRRVDAPAPVSIVLIDPAQVPAGSKITPREAKIARWDFPADAVASMFRGMNTSKVIDIEASWPDQPPKQKKLLLFVQYTTRDGRKLRTPGLPIEIARSADRTTHVKPPRHEPPAEEEISGPALAREEPAARSAPEDDPPENRRETLHTATRENAPRLERPVWSPERR